MTKEISPIHFVKRVQYTRNCWPRVNLKFVITIAVKNNWDSMLM
jgi:hypothetical protein